MGQRILVLGIGNTLWADEGVGPRAAALMQASYAAYDEVEIVDGGTQGLYLLPWVQEADCLLVLDAVDFGRTPGEIVVLRDSEIPAFFGQRPLSLHQTAFTDVLAAAELTASTPKATTLVGIQLENISEWGGGLSARVAQALPAAIEIGRNEIAAWRQRACEEKGS